MSNPPIIPTSPIIQDLRVINRLNNVLNDSGIPNSSTYFGIKEFNDTFDSKIFNGPNLFHLNIFLTYNFDKLH